MQVMPVCLSVQWHRIGGSFRSQPPAEAERSASSPQQQGLLTAGGNLSCLLVHCFSQIRWSAISSPILTNSRCNGGLPGSDAHVCTWAHMLTNSRCDTGFPGSDAHVCSCTQSFGTDLCWPNALQSPDGRTLVIALC